MSTDNEVVVHLDLTHEEAKFLLATMSYVLTRGDIKEEAEPLALAIGDKLDARLSEIGQ